MIRQTSGNPQSQQVQHAHHRHHHHHGAEHADNRQHDRVDVGGHAPGQANHTSRKWNQSPRHGEHTWRAESATASTGGHLAGAAAAYHARGIEAEYGRRPPVTDLKLLADRAMQGHSLYTDFGGAEQTQLKQIQGPSKPYGSMPDMREMLWCSIDNDDSRDLDQLTVSKRLDNGDVRIYVAIADVDALIPKGTALDKHAANNTTSVYTADKIFPMLPTRLSTDLTSLNGDVDRTAMVTEYTVTPDGEIKDPSIHLGFVRNHAKLAYNSVAAWLDGKQPMPERVAAAPGMEDQLRTQDEVAQRLMKRRHEKGSLTLDSLEAKADVKDGKVLDIRLDEKNRAKEIIEDFMVSTNGVTARFLHEKGYPNLMRVVREPEKWDRIVKVADDLGYKLPSKPDSAELEKFLIEQKGKDPVHFPDLSLTVVKLMGRGEYVVQRPEEDSIGHFGLAVKDYSHSTAPNRRFPDLITQRILKAALEGKPCPYSPAELDSLAELCSQREDDANKVERQIMKSAAALHLADKIGQRFDAIVTGAGEKGTWVRLQHPPAEGKLTQGQAGVQVGDQIRVKLIDVNVERGFIDFARSGRDD